MADNIPNVPAGAVPPKKETGMVQPKKETVRINLPPKPTAAPAAAAPAPPAPRASAAPMSMASKPGPTQSTSAPAPRSAPVGVKSVSGLDVGLAVAAMIFGLVAVGTTLYLIYGIPTN